VAVVSGLFRDHALWALAWCVFGFVAGSIPFGLLLAARIGKTDVRTQGSGNIGAANVARVVGKRLGLLTLVLDALKGALPAWWVTQWNPVDIDGVDGVERGLLAGLVGVAAVCGHCFPPWLAFRGGKGVATGLGVVAVLAPEAAAYGLSAFAVAFAGSKIVSVSSLSAAVVVVVALIVRGPIDVRLVPLIACVVLIVLRHRDNLQRLRRREELSL
jgi:acyl phosphate:glycerol-3-phosphate acyltransferase